MHRSREAQYLQNDYYSDFAKKLTDIIIPVLDNYSHLMNESELRVFNELNNWDYIILTDVGLSTFINVFTYNISNNLFGEIFNQSLFKKFTFVSNIPTRLILEMLTDLKYSFYLNQLIGSKIKASDYIIFETYRETIKYLINTFNSSLISNWKYSILHTLTLEHVLSKNKFLSPALNIGPFEMSGNNTTVNNTEWSFTKPYEVKIGASMRFIADLDEDFVYTVIPGGASGDPASANYSDQIRIWLNGGYIKLPFGKKPGQNYKLSVSILPNN
jgi:acyl-homoserine lactone acylase PvdQ